MKLKQMEMAIRSRAEQANQEISDEEMSQFLMTQFAQHMQQMEAQAYKQFNTTQEEVQAATNTHKDDPEIKAAIAKLRSSLAALTYVSCVSCVTVRHALAQQQHIVWWTHARTHACL